MRDELRDRRLRDHDRSDRRLPRPPRPRASAAGPGARAKPLVKASSVGPARISRLTLRVSAGTSEQLASHGPSCSFRTSFPGNRSRDSAPRNDVLVVPGRASVREVACSPSGTRSRPASPAVSMHPSKRSCVRPLPLGSLPRVRTLLRRGLCSGKRRSQSRAHSGDRARPPERGRCAMRRHSVSQMGIVSRGVTTSLSLGMRAAR